MPRPSLPAVLVPAAVLGLLTAGPSAALGGVLIGQLRTVSGSALPQVVLSLSGPAARTAVTGPEGRYRVLDLPPGTYEVSVDAPGFVLVGPARVTLDDGEEHLDLVLGPAPVREQVVVAATRSEAPLSALGVSATVLDRERIGRRHPTDLVHLLEEVPGTAVARAGGVGLVASAFVRGGESRFARVLVDGIPVNEPGGLYSFGTQLPLELERLEVVRGAASSLYGTDALAGVIQVVTRRAGPAERPSLRAEAEGGSFAWRRFAGGAAGSRSGFDFSGGLQRIDTDNEQPNGAFGQTAAAANAGLRLGGRGELRLVLRAEDGRAGTPGQTAYLPPDLDASFERTDVVGGLRFRRAGDRLAQEARLGLASSSQVSVNPLDSGCSVPESEGRRGPFPVCDFPSPSGFQNETRRLSAGYQAELQAGPHLLTAGADLERETGELGDRSQPLLAPERTNYGAYLQGQFLLGQRVFLTLGGRVEHNDSYGTEAVPRAALAWRLRGGADSTTLRASGGAGIKEPDFFQSFGISLFARGNPDLEPERSRTFDLGIEQRLLGSRLRVEATLFHHRYLDQIAFTVLDFESFAGTFANLGETRARGLELALEAAPTSTWSLTAHYTLLDGEVIASGDLFSPLFAKGEPLLRRPRHQAHLSAEHRAPRFRVGAHLFLVGERADSDFLALGLTRNEGYARLDARLHVRLTSTVEAFLVSENVLDQRHQEVLGYPALGRSLRLGLRLDTGRRPRP